jgi:RimJ/RimL family protein N-acetyltransferase
MEFYPAHAAVPPELRTERVVLRPLRATDVELDYDAVMASAAQLRQWSQSDWPTDDFTLAENLADLRRHEREHLERAAFTFTVMNPMETRCLGCVYLTPPSPSIAAVREGVAHAAHVGFWVRTSEIENDLDRHLFAALRHWLSDEWAFERVVFGIAPREERQDSLFREAGLELQGEFALPSGRARRIFCEPAHSSRH